MKIKFTLPRLIRIVIAALSLIACFCAVWFIPGMEQWFVTQAGSSLLKRTSLGVILALLSIAAVTLIFGRLYCSVLCPLGILQDIMGIFRRRPFHFVPGQHKIRYAVFTFVTVCLFLGFTLPLTILMPSANFVMIVNNIFRELVQYADRWFHFLREPVSVRPVLTAMLFTWGIFLSILILVRWRGRVYCNTLCPVGSILGFLSRFSKFRIHIDGSKCVGCGECERNCKAGCIDAKNRTVNTEECVMCLNCLMQCPKDGIHYGTSSETLSALSQSRRAFLVAAGSGVAAAAVTKITGNRHDIPPMPPGAGSFDRFSAKCVGCGLCIGTCRGKVLTPSITQYGLRGFMQPYLDMNRGACQFDCRKCMEVCPCGALDLMELREKQHRRIGLARYTKELCVAYKEGSDCGACAEHCPVGALEMVEYNDTLIPRVNEKLCIGCGACQNICPVRPVQAIIVQGVYEQIPVDKPAMRKNVKLKAEEDFPF